MQPFTKLIIKNIQNIPAGSVATYGQIAHLSGNKRAARQVSRALHTMTEKYQLPWHRVINAQGQIVIKDKQKQKTLLENEGVFVDNNFKIDLSTYKWDISNDDTEWMEG